MSDSTAELTLVVSAKNLAGNVIGNFQSSLGKVASTAEAAGRRVTGAFRAVSSGVVNGLGNLTETLAQGGGLGEAMFMFGAYMAGQAAEALLETLIERVGSSALVAAIGAPISAAFTALGGIMAAAIPIGMALLPGLIVAAIIAAVVFLINNPEVVGKVVDFAKGIPPMIVTGLQALAGLLLDTFGKAWKGIVDAVGPFVGQIVDWFLSIPGSLVDLGSQVVGAIIDGLASLPGRLWRAITDAFTYAVNHLNIDIGPIHISGKGVTIDLPDFNVPKGTPANRGVPGHYASGGWAGLKGPELAWIGEREPELVTPRSQLGRGMGVRLEGVSERDIMDIIDRGLYVRLRRAVPANGRV